MELREYAKAGVGGPELGRSYAPIAAMVMRRAGLAISTECRGRPSKSGLITSLVWLLAAVLSFNLYLCFRQKPSERHLSLSATAWR